MSVPAACSVIIISYNSGKLLPTCLFSIFRALQGIEHQVIVLDNGSPEPIPPKLKDDYPAVEWMHSDRNLGFGTACNQGAARARHSYLFFVNPDTLVSKETFAKVLEYIGSRPDAGVVGCRILNGDGTLQWACRRSFPSPMGAVYKTLGLAWLFPKSKRFGSYNLTYLDPHESHEVDAVSGSFFCVRRELYQKVGGFDQDFFLYGEDLDICYRIQQAGFHNHYYPGTSIIHFKGQSSKTRMLKSYIDFYQAMLIFARKHPKFVNPVPLWLVSMGVFFAAALGVFSRLLPEWGKMGVDCLVLTLAWLAGSWVLDTGIHWEWLATSAVAIFLPMLLFGGYGFQRLSASQVFRKILPVSLACMVSGMVLVPLDARIAGLVLSGFALNWFWRRLLFWFRYFQGVFTGKRKRSVLLGSHEQVNCWFGRENLLPGRDLLGCISRLGAKAAPFHFLGSVADLPRIRALTGSREVLVVPDDSGFHEEIPAPQECGNAKFDTLLLIGHPDTSTFAMVDLNFLK